MANIKFSAEALNDLYDIKKYISEELCNDSAAISVVSKIMNRIKQLEAFPRSGESLASVVGFDTDYRTLICDNYKIFYRVIDGTVHIVRVLYGRRDYIRTLFGDIQEE